MPGRVTTLSKRMAQAHCAGELVARTAQGDERALGELYDCYAPGLLAMVLRILPDRAAAEEVIESVFLCVWHEARRYTHQSASVAAWLVILTRRAAIGRRRAERKLPATSGGHPDPLQRSLSWLPRREEVALLEDRHELLKKVVNQLPERQHRALQLALFEGLTEAEIAEKLREPLGSVKSGLRAAMRFLRHRLRAVLGTWAANI